MSEAPAAPPPPRSTWWTLARVAVITAALIALWLIVARPPARPEVDYSTAFAWIEGGKVKSVELSPDAIDGTLSSAQQVDGRSVREFHATRPERDDALLPALRAHDVTIRAVAEHGGLARFALALLPWLLIIAAWWWLSRRTQRSMLGPLSQFTKRGRRFEKSRSVSTTFGDVAGLGNAKRDLEEIVTFLKDPDRVERLGAKIPRGVLIVGPPGTGKTLIARAVAGEADVPFFSITASEFIEMFVGVGAARVRELFDDAKKNAPAIVFIDEIDAVGRVRGTGLGGGHDEREQTLNQLLAEMDGFAPRDLVVVLAATNRPDVLDPALLRPGRFDRRVVIDLPEVAARKDILGVHARGKPLAPDVDLGDLAAATPGFSGADLANLVNEAALQAMRANATAIARAHFSLAYDKIVLGDPREGRLGAVEKRRVAVHEAGHAVVAWAIPEADPLRRISILPRGFALGATEQMPVEDRHVATRGELDAKLSVLLGGYASEQLVLAELSTGAERDLKEATRLAEQMVAHYGMSDALGPVYYEHNEQHAFLGHRIATEGGPSEATVHAIEEQARGLLERARARAAEAIEHHRAELDRLVAKLAEKETLEKSELEQVLGARPSKPAGATDRIHSRRSISAKSRWGT